VTTTPVRALLAVRSAPVEASSSLLELLPAAGANAWVRDGDGLVGWGCVARLEVSGPDRFAVAEAWWRELLAGMDVVDEVGVHGSGPVAFGSFSFAEEGSSVLVVPEVVVGRRDGRWWVTTFGGASELPERSAPTPPGTIRYADGSRSATDWVGVVAEAVRRIEAAEVEKVVLARDVEVRTDQPLDVRWPLGRLAADYPQCWTFCVDGLLGATPEMLVRLERGAVTSRVLAGTLPRSGITAQDERKGQGLARSIKDVEEHGYGVRSVVESLSRHCDRLDVPSAPFVLELPNVMHLATDVAGEVVDGSTSLGLLASLHPSAAVCGAPTPQALAVISEIEGLDRGRYAGPVGWLDARGDGEWGIALRCAEVDPADPHRLRLFAGCGIVSGSQPEAELAESMAKLVPMRSALEGQDPTAARIARSTSTAD
jgi:menaquinone-specific isochorismate synthase